MPEGETDAVAQAWNEDHGADLDEFFKQLVGAEHPPYRATMNGTEPVTDRESKTVVLQAERKDNVIVKQFKHRFTGDPVPDEGSVVKRTHTYYGPELMLAAEVNGEGRNYLLTAPGPDADLLLWAGITNVDDDGTRWRSGWKVAAEVQAAMATEQPPYETCSDCGERIRTIQHERDAAIGVCSRAQ